MEEKIQKNCSSSIDNSQNCLEIKNKENDLFKLPKEEDIILEENGENEKRKAEKNLLFNLKKISCFYLYYHISGKYEMFLMIAATAFTLGVGCSNSLIALLIGNTINKFTDASKIDGLPDSEYDSIVDIIEPNINKMVKIYLIFGACMFVCNFFMMFLWAYSALRQMHLMKINYFNLILKQEQAWFDENNAFEFATKVQAQIEQIEIGVGDRFGQIILMVAEIISGFVVGFIASWKLTLMLFTCLPFVLGSFAVLGICMEGVIVSSRKTYEKAGGIAEELLYNIKTVASFVNFDYELKRFGKLVDEVESYDRKKSLILAISIGVMMFGVYFGYTMTLIYARKLIANKEKNTNTGKPYSPGDIIKVLFSVINAIYAIGSIGPNIEIINEACISASDYFYLYERVPNIYISDKNLRPNKEDIRGKIEFKNIKFIYPSDKTQKSVLENLDLTIESGQKIAIVGESGCGKSTIVNLIERLYEPVDGEVLIDGIDIKDYNLEYLRSFIGYVQQEPVLFNRSIKDNIIFGRQNQLNELGNPEELMKEACTDAYIKEFIEKTPEKYEYIVGVKGGKLSGGQKQRIAIARAILTKPKILILDEATSALDNQSEKEVQRALDNISKKNVTMVIIAHRLSTIMNADVIFFLKNGRVMEKGTHQQLLEKNGYYAELFKSQMTKEELAKIENSPMIYHKLSLENDLDSLSNHQSNVTSNPISDKKEDKKEDVKIERRRIFELIDNYKLELIFGTLGGIIYGAAIPIIGFILGKLTNLFSTDNSDKIKKTGLKWCLVHLAMAVI